MSQNKNSTVDWSRLIVAAVALLLLVIVLGQAGSIVPAGGAYQHGGAYYPGLNVGNLLQTFLYLLIKVLWLLLLVSVLAGLLVALKKYVMDTNTLDMNPLVDKLTGTQYFCPACNEKLSQEFKFCPKCKASLQNKCTKCDKKLLPGWVCCPDCGTEKE